VWDAVTGQRLLTLKGHAGAIPAAAFSHDGQRIVTASNDHTAKVWDAVTAKELLTIGRQSSAVNSVAFSPDGQRIVTGSADGTAQVWDAASGRVILTLNGHNDAIETVAFSPDGRRIVTCSDDYTAKVWDAACGRELLTLNGNSGPVRDVAFSPDGCRIVTGNAWGHTAMVWEAATPEQVAAWQGEDQAAEQHLAALQRERTAEQERQRVARARDSIKQWLVLAPIPLATGQSGTDGLDIAQIAGESGIQPKAGEASSIGGRELKWREVALTNGVIDFNAILGQITEHSVAYAVCYIWSGVERHGLQMLVESDDEAKVYLNGKQVHKWPSARNLLASPDKVLDLSLHAGRNVLVFKVVNEAMYWQGSIRITDAQGNPATGIKVTLNPEAKD
jgi:hypothetical protein